MHRLPTLLLVATLLALLGSAHASSWVKVYAVDSGTTLSNVIVPQYVEPDTSHAIYLNMAPSGAGICCVRYWANSRRVDTVLITKCFDPQYCGPSRIDDVSPFDPNIIIDQWIDPSPTYSRCCYGIDTLTKLLGVPTDGHLILEDWPATRLGKKVAVFDPDDRTSCYLMAANDGGSLFHGLIDSTPIGVNDGWEWNRLPFSLWWDRYMLVVDHHHPRTLWVSVNDVLYRTTDRGKQWSVSCSSEITGMASNASGSMWIAVGNGGIFRSADSGGTFTLMNPMFAQCVTIDTATSTVYVGSGHTIYRSTDGATYTAYNNVFSTDTIVAVIANVSSNLLAATTTGLYEITGQEVGVNETLVPLESTVLEAFPNPISHSLSPIMFIPGIVRGARVEIYDILGRHCDASVHNTETRGMRAVDVSRLSPGAYVVRVIEERRPPEQRVVVVQ